jgi:hypothetical protein
MHQNEVAGLAGLNTKTSKQYYCNVGLWIPNRRKWVVAMYSLRHNYIGFRISRSKVFKILTKYLETI